jgi:hypothetical protein
MSKKLSKNEMSGLIIGGICLILGGMYGYNKYNNTENKYSNVDDILGQVGNTDNESESAVRYNYDYKNKNNTNNNTVEFGGSRKKRKSNLKRGKTKRTVKK